MSITAATTIIILGFLCAFFGVGLGHYINRKNEYREIAQEALDLLFDAHGLLDDTNRELFSCERERRVLETNVGLLENRMDKHKEIIQAALDSMIEDSPCEVVDLDEEYFAERVQRNGSAYYKIYRQENPEPKIVTAV